MRAVYESLREDVLKDLREAMPVDMVLLPQQVPVPTPEPGTLLLFGLGGGFLWLLRKKKGMTAG